MPVIEAHVIEGYPDEALARLTGALTDAVRMVVPAPDAAITVLVHQVAPAGYARGGVARSPAPALPDPAGIVRAYLDAMERRDLAAARAFLGPGFEMVFPGTAPMRTLEDLIAWSAGRYRFVTKAYDGVECLPGDGVRVVYARGTLSGAWPDGSAFSGIRFVDRFEITGDRITRQDVWNDLAEVRPR